MHVLALLGCFALASCALGVLGLARVSKDRRGLKRYEHECLLDPLSLPHKQQQQQQHDSASVVIATAMRSLARGLISSRLLAPLVAEGVEQHPPSPVAGAATSAHRIREFVLQAALRLSGLALLMANQHQPPSVMTNNNNAYAEQDQHESKNHHLGKPQSTTTWFEDDDDDDDSFADEQDESDRTLCDSNGDDADDEDEDETFEDPFEQPVDDADAQRVLLDGLQFYTVLSQVGAATVRSVVQQAVRNSVQSAATSAQQQASISAIGQRYPDILCLSAPSYAQHTTRADLATALLAVSAAAALQQQQQLSQQHCGSMERRLSIKRPDALALAAEDAMEPMRRTPLTSPSSSQLEPSFLQAA